MQAGSDSSDLDGARLYAAAIAIEEARLQGPPRRATVIRASRMSPGTEANEKWLASVQCRAMV